MEKAEGHSEVIDLIMSQETQPEAQFAVCINNDGYQASIEVGKLYRVIPDEQAASHGYIRIVDESGEDYGYTADRFYPLEIPRQLAQALRAA